MAPVQAYPLGTPCWFELSAKDQNQAKQFYSRLFGWIAADLPMGPGAFYTMFELGERHVAAAYTQPAELRAAGVPASWSVYFATPDVDASAAKVVELGGTLLQPPVDVQQAGRMAICKDPGGATFALWQANVNIGAGSMGEPNTVCWSELATYDTAKARDFYTALFGWQTKPSANMPTYIEYSTAGTPRGGLLPMDDQWCGAPSHWCIYVRVADCDAAVARAVEMGACVKFGPFDAPGVGRMAALDDPQGAGFYVIKLDAA